MIGFGVYLRKFMVEHLERNMSVTLDTQQFGKFTLANDPEADSDNIYPKKIVYEATGMLA